MSSASDEVRPLLSSDRHRLHLASQDHVAKVLTNSNSIAHHTRRFLQWFLTSKWGHYFVIVLVTLDVCGIFASFLIKLHMCEHSGENLRKWKETDSALGILSLTFSCLFVIELVCSCFAFGIGYFSSKFHCFDALSIVASFLVDVLTHGPVEEAGSLIIVLRLFRVFKIIEESSTVAEQSMGELHSKIAKLETENASLRQRRSDRSNSAEHV